MPRENGTPAVGLDVHLHGPATRPREEDGHGDWSGHVKREVGGEGMLTGALSPQSSSLSQCSERVASSSW